MANRHLAWFSYQEARLTRRAELARGWLLRLRGARTGVRFGLDSHVTVIHPECLRAGDDVKISRFSYLNCLSEQGVVIGSNTSFDRNLWLHCGGSVEDSAHGFVFIGDHSYVGCNAVLGAGGGLRIGSHVLIGQSVNIHSENHNFMDANRLISEQGVRYDLVTIEDDVWIGSKATILAGVTVGKGAVIAGGAVVTRSIPPYAVAVGVPARVVRYREPHCEESQEQK